MKKAQKRSIKKESASTSAISTREFRVVKIDDIFEDPNNERKTLTNLDDLANSISRVGILEPITVTPEGDKLRAVTGHRRLRAAKLAGLTHIEVVIGDAGDEMERRVRSLISNLQRENVNVVDMVDALDAMLAEGDFFPTQRDLADALGKSEPWLSNLLAIKGMPAPLREKLRASELPVSYDVASRIARIQNEKTQARLVDLLLSGATTRNVREKIAPSHRRPRRAHFESKLDGYVAVVSGPSAPNEREKAIAVINKLVDEILALSPSAEDDPTQEEGEAA